MICYLESCCFSYCAVIGAKAFASSGDGIGEGLARWELLHRRYDMKKEKRLLHELLVDWRIAISKLFERYLRVSWCKSEIFERYLRVSWCKSELFERYLRVSWCKSELFERYLRVSWCTSELFERYLRVFWYVFFKTVKKIMQFQVKIQIAFAVCFEISKQTAKQLCSLL